MKIKDSVKQITLDLFQNCDVPEEVNVTFDPEVDLNDDTIGRYRYERLYSARSTLCERKYMCSKTFSRAQSSGAFEGTFACEVEATILRTHFKEYPEVFPNS